MIELIIVLIPLLITDVVNPVLLTGVIYSLGSRKPYLNASSVLFGWFLIYFLAGIGIAIGFDALVDLLDNPKPIHFIIQIVVSILLFFFAAKLIKSDGNKDKRPEFDESKKLTLFGAFWIGASINLIGLPFAIPYFAVMDQIIKSDLNVVKAVTVLVIYNLLYILPFVVLMIIRKIFGKKGDNILNKINEWMDRISAFLMPLLLIGIGLALLVDAGYYFFSGNPLF